MIKNFQGLLNSAQIGCIKCPGLDIYEFVGYFNYYTNTFVTYSLGVNPKK